MDPSGKTYDAAVHPGRLTPHSILHLSLLSAIFKLLFIRTILGHMVTRDLGILAVNYHASCVQSLPHICRVHGSAMHMVPIM
jgi:hypothetical protein